MGNKTSIRIVNSQVRSKPKNHQSVFSSQLFRLSQNHSTSSLNHLFTGKMGFVLRFKQYTQPRTCSLAKWIQTAIAFPSQYFSSSANQHRCNFSTDSQSAVLVWDPSGYNASLQSWYKKILCGLWWSLIEFVFLPTPWLTLVWGRCGLPWWKQRIIATNNMNYILFLVNALMFYHECFPSIPINQKS